MKFTSAIVATLFSLTAFTAAIPVIDSFGFGCNILTLKSCSGDRGVDDVCSGKKLQPQNSFHNCKNSGGKCCALNSNGSGGIDVSKGLGREDCGYCFSGKCS